jgi:osmotically inducible lipoprotein OsmB
MSQERKRKVALWVVATALAAGSLSGCDSMSQQQKGAAVGAVAGGVLGNVLTDSTLGTVGGAAIGGVIGAGVSR